MRNRIVSAIAALLLAAPAWAQTPFSGLVFPPRTVLGNTGPQSDFGQAIPLTVLAPNVLNSLCQTAGAIPVYSTVSGWQCSTAGSGATINNLPANATGLTIITTLSNQLGALIQQNTASAALLKLEANSALTEMMQINSSVVGQAGIVFRFGGSNSAALTIK